MKLSKWIVTFFTMIILTAAAVCGFNYAVDPFGVFGDKILKWDSYNMVNNPRVAKIGYLDQHHEKYDSYIIGGSKSSSISPELLNKYYGDARFYSMMMYGGDFHDYEKTLYYLVDNYEVKNIVLHMSLHEIGHFHEEATDFKQELHGKVEREGLLPFYFKYLTLNPSYSFSKLEGLMKRSIDPFEYAQIVPETGVYNKEKRDAEEIGDIDEFLAANPDFELPIADVEAVAIDKNAASLKRMKEYCEARGIHFMLITGATYTSELDTYKMEDLKEYWRKLADVTDFWDFSGYTALSDDPRYYYDSMHYRNNVGEMILAYIFDDPDVYVPENFGHLTTAENVDEHVEKVFTKPEAVAGAGEEKDVPVLVYHHISEDASLHNSMIVSPEKFEADMLALKEAGYETVFFQDLVDYVNGDGDLPEKPALVTFDDGYLSNYEYAYPVLKELDLKATIAVIGWSVGRDEHRIPGEKFYPHFTWAQAREMVDSGVIDIQSHSYDMHEMDDEGRFGVLRMEGESEGDYARALKADLAKLRAQIEREVGNDVIGFAYPFGAYDLLSEQILADEGYKVTLSTTTGINTIRRGDPHTLFALKRINAGSEVPSEELINKMEETLVH